IRYANRKTETSSNEEQRGIACDMTESLSAGFRTERPSGACQSLPATPQLILVEARGATPIVPRVATSLPGKQRGRRSLEAAAAAAFAIGERSGVSPSDSL